ncbi:hypothetical protein TNCV_3535091 [Trichonephila clavipes]|nr:hypothetical protein TNCV_3535091 [Trichonephila clavipes]
MSKRSKYFIGKKTGKQLPKVEMPGENKLLQKARDPQGCPDIEEEVVSLKFLEQEWTILMYVTLDSGVHEQMFQSSGQFDAKPPVLSSQASVVLIYRPTEKLNGQVNLAQPGI